MTQPLTDRRETTGKLLDYDSASHYLRDYCSMSGSVSANYLRGIGEYLLQRELDADAFWAGFGLNADMLEEPSRRIPIEIYQSMLQQAAELAQDASAALHIGECIKPGQYGVLGYSVMSCKTAQQAFDRHMRYENLVSDRSISTYHFENDHVRLSWDTGDLPVDRAMAEENIASWITFTRWVTGQSLSPSVIKFTHSEPEDLTEYRRIFGCELLFSQTMVEVIFPSSYMDMPIIQHDPVMREMMDAYADRLLNELSQCDVFIAQIRKLMIEAMTEGDLSLDVIAAQVALTPRTLQRRLSEQDESFKGLLDKVRKELALTYINQPFIDLAELAYLLGFSDQTAFQRAFKKWTGSSPGKYRKENAA